MKFPPKQNKKTGNVINHLWEVFANFQIGNIKGLILGSKLGLVKS